MGRVLTIGDILSFYRNRLREGALPVDAAHKTAEFYGIIRDRVMETVGDHLLTVMVCEKEADDRKRAVLAYLQAHPRWHPITALASCLWGSNRWRHTYAKEALTALLADDLVEHNGKASYRAKEATMQP